MTGHLLALCENIKNPLSATSTSVLSIPVATPPLDSAAADAPVDNAIQAPPQGVVSGVTSTDNEKKDYAEIARNVFRIRLTAALCREILKMGMLVTIHPIHYYTPPPPVN